MLAHDTNTVLYIPSAAPMCDQGEVLEEGSGHSGQMPVHPHVHVRLRLLSDEEQSEL